jgi:hypothetical protein
MPRPPLTGPSSALLAALLAAACTARHEEPQATPPPSMGLPTLSTADAGPTAAVPDATTAMDGPQDAAAAGPDGPPDVAVDLPADRPPPPPDLALDRTLAEAALCSATTATAKPLPVDIFVLLDRSDSMRDPVSQTIGDGGITFLSRWDSMEQALISFANSPAAAGLSIGLGFFPTTTGFGCTAADYATPAVPIDVLPAVAPTFTAAIAATGPGGATPTLPAMQGAIQYAKQREMTLGRRTAIALATDGLPNDCSSSVQSVANAAAMAASEGIYTFVIGVGSSMSAFSTIAMAGGTQTAYQVENATPTALATAFRNIQMKAAGLACTFMVPPPPAGEMLDPFKVSVTFTPTATPAQAFGLTIVASRNDCGPTGGWYFDDLTNPTKLTLCDVSCQKVNGAGEGALSLLFGCVAK